MFIRELVVQSIDIRVYRKGMGNRRHILAMDASVVLLEQG